MKGALRLGRFSGTEVIADASALLLAGLFAGAVYIHLQQVVPEMIGELAGVLAVVSGIAVLGSVFLHEAGHVLVAKRLGLTVQSIRLNMFGGHSVIDGAPSARTEFLVSAAGPITSFALSVLLFSGPIVLGYDTPVGSVMWALGLANLAIGVFNLLPGFPLDGGRIVRSILSRGGRDRVEATRVATTIGRVIGFVVMAMGAVFVVNRDLAGVSWIVVGWILTTTAASAGRREELTVTFQGMVVADVMRATPAAVSGDSTIANVLDLYEIGPRLRSLPVEMSGRVVGVIGREEVDSIAPSRWPSMRVRALMTRIVPDDIVDADAPLESLLLRPAGLSGRAVVVRDGVVVGIIDADALASDLRN